MFFSASSSSAPVRPSQGGAGSLSHSVWSHALRKVTKRVHGRVWVTLGDLEVTRSVRRVFRGTQKAKRPGRGPWSMTCYLPGGEFGAAELRKRTK